MRADEVIAAFGAAWNTVDDGERLQLLAACCLPEAVFAAPQDTESPWVGVMRVDQRAAVG